MNPWTGLDTNRNGTEPERTASRFIKLFSNRCESMRTTGTLAMLVYQRVKITIALQQWSSFATRLLGGHRHLLPILGLGCSQAIQLAPCEARGWGCIKLPMKLPYRSRWTNYSNPCNPITPPAPHPQLQCCFFGLVRSFEWKKKSNHKIRNKDTKRSRWNLGDRG